MNIVRLGGSYPTLRPEPDTSIPYLNCYHVANLNRVSKAESGSRSGTPDSLPECFSDSRVFSIGYKASLRWDERISLVLQAYRLEGGSSCSLGKRPRGDQPDHLLGKLYTIRRLTYLGGIQAIQMLAPDLKHTAATTPRSFPICH